VKARKRQLMKENLKEMKYKERNRKKKGWRKRNMGENNRKRKRSNKHQKESREMARRKQRAAVSNEMKIGGSKIERRKASERSVTIAA